MSKRPTAKPTPPISRHSRSSRASSCAKTAISGMGAHMILHAGPPIAWDRMCGPMQGAIAGAIVSEGWAQNDAEARGLIESGAVRCEPCHDHGAVGPMAGVISPSMPVWIVRDAESGHRTYSNLNEGLGKAASFRRKRRDGARPIGVDEDQTARGARRGIRSLRADRTEAADGSGAAHGRRGPQPECGGDVSACSRSLRPRCSDPGPAVPMSPRSSSSSQATITSFSTSRWPRAKR